MNISVNPLTLEAHKILDNLDDSLRISDFLQKNEEKKVIVAQGLGFVGAVMSLVCANALTEEYAVIGVLKEMRIQSSKNCPPFWDFTAYKGQFSPNDSPVTADICRRQLTHPLFPTVTDDEVDLVCNPLLEALA